MKEQSRRQFLYCCLCLAASGAATTLFTAPAGCKERDKTASTGIAKPGIKSAFEAAYLKLQKTGELKRRGQVLWRMMASCELCPRTCGVNRIKGEEGFCQASMDRVLLYRAFCSCLILLLVGGFCLTMASDSHADTPLVGPGHPAKKLHHVCPLPVHV